MNAQSLSKSPQRQLNGPKATLSGGAVNDELTKLLEFNPMDTIYPLAGIGSGALFALQAYSEGQSLLLILLCYLLGGFSGILVTAAVYLVATMRRETHSMIRDKELPESARAPGLPR